MPLKPLAVMIKKCYQKMILTAMLMTLLFIVLVIMVFIHSLLWNLLWIPIGFLAYCFYEDEQDMKDYLVSI